MSTQPSLRLSPATFGTSRILVRYIFAGAAALPETFRLVFRTALFTIALPISWLARAPVRFVTRCGDWAVPVLHRQQSSEPRPGDGPPWGLRQLVLVCADVSTIDISSVFRCYALRSLVTACEKLLAIC
jgi:hypothetical protein